MTADVRNNAYNTEKKLAISPTDAAKALSISRAKFYSMLASGEVPSIKIGRITRVPVAALEEWINTQLGEHEPR